MPREPRFVTIEQVRRLHAYAIEDQGGDPAIRDIGLLESALAQPRQQFDGAYLHPTIPSMAAAYGFHICKNHPFIDGNKRAATTAMIKFLADNGWSFDATADEAEPVILELAAGSLSKEGLTAWLEKHCHEKPSLELREFFAQLTAEQLVEAGRALSQGSGSRWMEFVATRDDAMAAIPAISTLLDAFEDLPTAQQDEHVQGVAHVVKTLMGIYRLAEDQGYEW